MKHHFKFQQLSLQNITRILQNDVTKLTVYITDKTPTITQHDIETAHEHNI